MPTGSQFCSLRLRLVVRAQISCTARDFPIHRGLLRNCPGAYPPPSPSTPPSDTATPSTPTACTRSSAIPMRPHPARFDCSAHAFSNAILDASENALPARSSARIIAFNTASALRDSISLPLPEFLVAVERLHLLPAAYALLHVCQHRFSGLRRGRPRASPRATEAAPVQTEPACGSKRIGSRGRAWHGPSPATMPAAHPCTVPRLRDSTSSPPLRFARSPARVQACHPPAGFQPPASLPLLQPSRS